MVGDRHGVGPSGARLRSLPLLWSADTSPSNHMTPAEQTLTGPSKLGAGPSNLARRLRVWSRATSKSVLHWRVFAFFLEEVGVPLGSDMLS